MVREISGVDVSERSMSGVWSRSERDKLSSPSTRKRSLLAVPGDTGSPVGCISISIPSSSSRSCCCCDAPSSDTCGVASLGSAACARLASHRSAKNTGTETHATAVHHATAHPIQMPNGSYMMAYSTKKAAMLMLPSIIGPAAPMATAAPLETHTDEIDTSPIAGNTDRMPPTNGFSMPRPIASAMIEAPSIPRIGIIHHLVCSECV